MSRRRIVPLIALDATVTKLVAMWFSHVNLLQVMAFTSLHEFLDSFSFFRVDATSFLTFTVRLSQPLLVGDDDNPSSPAALCYLWKLTCLIASFSNGRLVRGRTFFIRKQKQEIYCGNKSNELLFNLLYSTLQGVNHRLIGTRFSRSNTFSHSSEVATIADNHSLH